MRRVLASLTATVGELGNQATVVRIDHGNYRVEYNGRPLPRRFTTLTGAVGWGEWLVRYEGKPPGQAELILEEPLP